MAHGIEVKRALRGAYVHEMLSMEDAAIKAGISLGTATRWKREAKADSDDWDKARAARFMSEQGSDFVVQSVLEQFVTVFQTTITQLKTAENISPLSKADALAKLSDAFHKTMSAARKGSPEVNKLAVAQDVINLLCEFVGTKFPQHGQALLDVIEPFGKYLTENLVQ